MNAKEPPATNVEVEGHCRDVAADGRGACYGDSNDLALKIAPEERR